MNLVTNKKIIVFFLAVIFLYSVQNVCAVENSDDDTKHKHDSFYLHLSTGFGGTSSSEEDEIFDLGLSGASGNSKIGIGYALADNFIVSVDFFGSVMVDPEVSLNGESLGEADAEFSIATAGVGITYYFMPANFYLSGSIGLASGELETDLGSYDTDLGYGINLAISKEWWVSKNWGIGIASHLFYSSLPDENILGDVSYLNTTSFAILFSATLN